MLISFLKHVCESYEAGSGFAGALEGEVFPTSQSTFSPTLSELPPSASLRFFRESFTASRFVITCCAADAYPVTIPVKFTGTRQTYPQDSWFQVKGKAIVETFAGSRQFVIEASEIKAIPIPKNPYQE